MSSRKRHGPLLRWLANGAGLYLAVRLVSGIRFDGEWWALLLVALMFGFVNALLRPLLTLLTCPLVLLTLGLFTLVINGALLLFTAWLAEGLGLAFTVDGLWSGVLGALLISVVSVVISSLVKGDAKNAK